MTASIPIYEPLVARADAAEDFHADVRREHAISMPEECAPRVAFPASDAAAGVAGQAIGIGGDRVSLYSHPAELVAELRDGGWTAEEIAARWDDAFASSQQPYGIQLPVLVLS